MLSLCSGLMQKKGASAGVSSHPSVSTQTPAQGELVWAGDLENLNFQLRYCIAIQCTSQTVHEEAWKLRCTAQNVYKSKEGFQKCSFGGLLSVGCAHSKCRKDKLQVSLAQCFLFQFSICLQIECKYIILISHSKLFTICLQDCPMVYALLLHCKQ